MQNITKNNLSSIQSADPPYITLALHIGEVIIYKDYAFQGLRIVQRHRQKIKESAHALRVISNIVITPRIRLDNPVLSREVSPGGSNQSAL